MKAVLIGLCLGPVVCHAEIPTLRFDDKVTWEQVFDSGFRPKHLIPRGTCECRNQAFVLKFKDRAQEFPLETGRVAFSLGNNDVLRMIWHQGREPITLEEGKRRVDSFRVMFDGYIVKEMIMPRLIDPSGLVDAGNAENNIEARIGKWRIWYGFDNSLGKMKPIIPHLYIALHYPGRPEEPLKPLNHIVKPPAGYEWYSLDPKVDTPDPGSSPKAAPGTVESVSRPDEITMESKRSKLPQEEKQEQDRGGFAWIWRIGLMAGVVLAALLLKRRFSKSSA
jgi:hypothetical protein